MRIRGREVAERAGVSEATVSRVLNGRPGVSERTRSIVLRAAAELGVHGFRPIVRASAGLVGLVVPELDNPIFPVFAQRIEAELAAAGYTCVLGCATQRGVDEQEYLGMLVEREVVGFVMVSGRHADLTADQTPYRDVLANGFPMVFVNGYAEDVPASFVSCDDRLAAELAVSHLHALGHRRIGFVSGPVNYVVVARKREGFRQALAALGEQADDDLLIETVFSVEGGRAAAAALIERGATAVVAASDLLALGTVLGARDHGREVPGEWSAVGFDDTALMAYTDPPLTTVRQPVPAMCAHATRLLLDQISGGPTVRQEFVFRPELVVRASTERCGQAVELANLRLARMAKTTVMPAAQRTEIHRSEPGS